ncbi:MAG: hypothetical protein IKU48_01535, partial [Clostridia bacterium]|nr:hypothetical protein [Clostridia bacterium]
TSVYFVCNAVAKPLHSLYHEGFLLHILKYFFAPSRTGGCFPRLKAPTEKLSAEKSAESFLYKKQAPVKQLMPA